MLGLGSMRFCLRALRPGSDVERSLAIAFRSPITGLALMILISLLPVAC